MAKKKVEKPVAVVEESKEELTDMNGQEIDPAVLAKARIDMRNAMREKFGKWITVYEEDATDADIQEARSYFEAEVEKYKEQTYTLADKETAVATVKFLQEWNAKYNVWKNAAWRGIIAFDKVMTKTLEDLGKAENVDGLDIDYQTLMFLYHQMQVPSGVGLETAKAMAELENFDLEKNEIRTDTPAVTYTGVLSTVYEHVNRLAVVDKMLNLLRERVTIAAAGIKFDFKITELEEFKELADAWVLANDEVENAVRK